jgi:hypothetical protein
MNIGPWLALVLFAAVSAAFMPAVQFGNRKRPYWKRYLLVGLPSSFSLITVYLLFREYIDVAIEHIIHLASSYSGRGGIAIGVICAGIAAHALKKRRSFDMASWKYWSGQYQRPASQKACRQEKPCFLDGSL